MIITKKALPRRTFLRGAGAALALPLLDAMIPAMTALADTPASPGRCAAWASSTCRWAATSPAGRRPARTRSTSCRRSSARWRRSRSTSRSITQPGAAERLPRHARDLERRVPERRQGEAHREHRLLPRHDGRSDRRAADRPGHAAAVARAVDGPAVGRRPVRQRLRLRLSEQPLLVVADDAAAGRGPSADRLREPVRRRRQRRRAPRRAAEAGQPARLGHRRARPPATASSARPIAPGSASTSTPSARSSAASRRPRPTRRTTRCRTSTGRSACRPPTPTTPG